MSIFNKNPILQYCEVKYMKNWQDANLAEIVEQLESCGYECEAGVMTMNVAFQELKRRAEEN